MTACAFGPLTIAFDERVLEPRPWTVAQSTWAVELSRDLAPGPILELCAGAGHIGLLAAVQSGRAIVQVDADPSACAFAAENARAAGVHERVDIRCARLDDALHADESFPLVLADPPYLRSDDTNRFPRDPLLAVDGGVDGLEVIRAVLATVEAHLAPGGACLLQLAGPAQVVEVAALIEREQRSLVLESQRVIDGERAVALLRTNPR
jgi:release factor glutamine methyltransferase